MFVVLVETAQPTHVLMRFKKTVTEDYTFINAELVMRIKDRLMFL